MSSDDLTYGDVINAVRNASVPSAWNLNFVRRRENATTTEHTTTNEMPTTAVANSTEIHLDVIAPETEDWVNMYYERMFFSIVLVLLGLCIAAMIFIHVKQRRFGQVSRSRPPLGLRKYGRIQEMYPLDRCTNIAVSPTATVFIGKPDF